MGLLFSTSNDPDKTRKEIKDGVEKITAEVNQGLQEFKKRNSSQFRKDLSLREVKAYYNCMQGNNKINTNVITNPSECTKVRENLKPFFDRGRIKQVLENHIKLAEQIQDGFVRPLFNKVNALVAKKDKTKFEEKQIKLFGDFHKYFDYILSLLIYKIFKDLKMIEIVNIIARVVSGYITRVFGMIKEIESLKQSQELYEIPNSLLQRDETLLTQIENTLTDCLNEITGVIEGAANKFEEVVKGSQVDIRNPNAVGATPPPNSPQMLALAQRVQRTKANLENSNNSSGNTSSNSGSNSNSLHTLDTKEAEGLKKQRRMGNGTLLRQPNGTNGANGDTNGNDKNNNNNNNTPRFINLTTTQRRQQGQVGSGKIRTLPSRKNKQHTITYDEDDFKKLTETQKNIVYKLLNEGKPGFHTEIAKTLPLQSWTTTKRTNTRGNTHQRGRSSGLFEDVESKDLAIVESYNRGLRTLKEHYENALKVNLNDFKKVCDSMKATVEKISKILITLIFVIDRKLSKITLVSRNELNKLYANSQSLSENNKQFTGKLLEVIKDFSQTYANEIETLKKTHAPKNIRINLGERGANAFTSLAPPGTTPIAPPLSNPFNRRTGNASGNSGNSDATGANNNTPVSPVPNSHSSSSNVKPIKPKTGATGNSGANGANNNTPTVPVPKSPSPPTPNPKSTDFSEDYKKFLKSLDIMCKQTSLPNEKLNNFRQFQKEFTSKDRKYKLDDKKLRSAIGALSFEINKNRSFKISAINTSRLRKDTIRRFVELIDNKICPIIQRYYGDDIDKLHKQNTGAIPPPS